MADDWQPGDLALCICTGEGRWEYDDGVWFGPEGGSTQTVTEVCLMAGQVMLTFAEWPSDCSYEAVSFTKVTPKAPDAEDAETIRLLTGAPVREPAAALDRTRQLMQHWEPKP